MCNPIGNVLRIVIFKRNGIQAMVEYPENMEWAESDEAERCVLMACWLRVGCVFIVCWLCVRVRVGCVLFLDSAVCRFESVHCAQKAKAALNGADIYAGCCTLKIEYARVSIDTHVCTHARTCACSPSGCSFKEGFVKPVQSSPPGQIQVMFSILQVDISLHSHVSN